MDGGCDGVVVDMTKEVEKALAQRVTWMDQQGLPTEVVDRVAQDVKSMALMGRQSVQYHILAVAILLGIRAEHEAAAYLLDAYRRIESTPPPKRKGGQ